MHISKLTIRSLKTLICIKIKKETKGKKPTIFPQSFNDVVGGLLEKSYHIIIEGIHVLHQPLFTVVIYLARIMYQAETGLVSEVRLLRSLV